MQGNNDRHRHKESRRAWTNGQLLFYKCTLYLFLVFSLELRSGGAGEQKEKPTNNKKSQLWLHVIHVKKKKKVEKAGGHFAECACFCCDNQEKNCTRKADREGYFLRVVNFGGSVMPRTKSPSGEWNQMWRKKPGGRREAREGRGCWLSVSIVIFKMFLFMI